MKLTKEEKQQVKELAARYDLDSEIVLRQLVDRGLKSVAAHLHLQSVRNKRLRDLNIPKRCADALECAGYIYVKDVYAYGLDDFLVLLRAIPGIGRNYEDLLNEEIRKAFYEEERKLNVFEPVIND